MAVRVLLVLLVSVSSCSAAPQRLSEILHQNPTYEPSLDAFLENYQIENGHLVNQLTVADWNYNTNITEENAAIRAEIQKQVVDFNAQVVSYASRFNRSQLDGVQKRLFDKIIWRNLEKGKMDRLAEIDTEMGLIYSTHKVCFNETCCLELEPDLNNVMSQSIDPEERLWAWRKWHEGVGRKVRPLYVEYIKLKNEMARLNDFADYGDQWRQKYETEELQHIVTELYRQIEPLYKQLHAYIRRKLYNVYGGGVVDLTGPLPAHLIGDMWGRFWSNLNSIAQPYPDKDLVDPTDEMHRQNYTVERMFSMADDFFMSMGLEGLPRSFYERSMLRKPEGRDVVCHATAWDFYDGKDFRIKMCTKVNFEDFLTIHHELGHVQYFMQYAEQPHSFREGANDGFHEAIGEVMSMSVATTKHLRQIGLLDAKGEDDYGVDINFLLNQALGTISTLPFHLVQDTWRWKIFADQIPIEDWNAEYWRQKVEIVGVAPPADRDDSVDLDAVAIFHVANDYDMIRYFIRTVLQYQFAEILCNASDHTGPMYHCDFYNSTAAGEALAPMLKLGSSKSWQDAMQVLTGQREMSATPLLNYFEPLRLWLEEENGRNNELIGWRIDSPFSQ